MSYTLDRVSQHGTEPSPYYGKIRSKITDTLVVLGVV